MTRKSPELVSIRTPVDAFFSRQKKLLPGLALRFARQPGKSGFCLVLLDLLALDNCMREEGQPHVLTSLLSPAEQTFFATLNFAKRKREWLGGRLVCKAAVLHMDDCPAPLSMEQITILPAPLGAPLLSCPSIADWRPPAISLSHSERYVVGLAARKASCGVDIQKITSRTVRVADRFAAPAEVALLLETLPELNLPQRLTLLWTAKEALKKGLLQDQPSLFRGVSLLSVERGHHLTLRLRHPGDGGRPAVLTALFLDDYMLAFTPCLSHA